MERDEILAIYAAGPEAVVALVDELLRRVQALEDRLAVDSHNSHQSPSRDRSRKRRSLRPPSDRTPGGQPDHPGRTLAWSTTPDTVCSHRPARCATCGASLADQPVVGVARRQVVELPVLRVTTTEHTAAACRCGVCGAVTRARFPPEVRAPLSYGPELTGLAVYLNQAQLLPAARTAAVIRDLFGSSLSAGTVTRMVTACHTALAATEATTKAALQQTDVAHFDETGLWVAGRQQWVHVASTTRLTHYGIQPRRGQAGMQAVGVLPTFHGVAVHDGLSSYLAFGAAHGLCNVHHLRDLTFLAEEHQQAWAADLKRLFQTMQAAVRRVRMAGRTELTPAARRRYTARYRELVNAGLQANPPAAKAPSTPGPPKRSRGGKLALRLATQPEAVLRFLHDFRVPFDNNQAERDLRMVKLRQKISGGFRTPTGADQFARIRGYLSTAHKQGHSPLRALQAACAGHPFVLA
jgi:transposase